MCTHYITPALVSYLCSLVVRALHRHRKGVGSIPAGGPIVDDVFLNCSWLEFRHVYDFLGLGLGLGLKTIYPSDIIIIHIE